MDCFGNRKWLLNLFLLSAGFYMTGANIRFANEGGAIQLYCPHNEVNSWQAGTHEFLVDCEGEKPMINENLSKSNRLNISSDCTILTITYFTEEDVGKYICFFKDMNKPNAYGKHEIHVKIRLKPRIKITSSRNPVITKGQTIILTCHDENEKNGNIDTFLWTHASSLLTYNTKNLTFENATQSIAGEYVCISQNTAGRDAASINITVNYSPVVSNRSVTLFTSNGPRTLECSAVGVPDVYDFGLWQHYSYNYELIRSLEGNTNGTLILRNDVSTYPIYEDSGLYRCSVSNGVSDERGHLWQNGTIKVTIEGKPVLAKPHYNSYIGQMYATSIMSIFVLSSSNVTRAVWFSEHNIRLAVTPCIPSIAGTLFYRIPVKSSGYECQFKIHDTRREDLQKYKVDIENKYGKSTFEISLILAEEKSNDTKSYWVAFLLVFVVIIPVCIVLTKWRLTAKKRWPDNSNRPNEERFQVEGGAIENNLYQGANDLIEQPSVSSNREDEAYSCIDRRKQIVHKQNVTYQIKDQLENNDHHRSSINNGLDPLNYVEVVFDNTTHNGEFCIHGADARTPYADIDFSARADPLIISKENEESLSSCSVENGDFVSLEEVQQWMIVNE